MKLHRIRAILLQEYFITKRSMEVSMDLFFFSIMNVVVFGYVSVFLSNIIGTSARHYILLGILLWEVIRVAQYSMSVGALWNIWSRNLSNMFISPLSILEYLFTHMLSGTVKAFVVFAGVSFIASVVFNFHIVALLGWTNLVVFFLNLLIFAWTTGIAILGLIFRFGNRIQAFAWALVALFQPLTATLFPVSVLPPALQRFTFLFPPTYVFEAARAALSDSSVNWNFTLVAFSLNLFYFFLALWFFSVMYRISRTNGQFARNEG